ncbi:Hypothetical predicted protein [Mytilus galloprovincialis]|uniref:DUF7042 domain-containing protein n=1 Tax=Mytilus galloprovincialis TaxID=29158 RepID=A0A8B6C5H5_MYTGA|nr:Hypothetical predicted protein [Mytilus galloprovincialis]
MEFLIKLVVFLGIFVRISDTACSHWPSVWDGQWYDSYFHEESSNGMITFSQSDKKVTTGWTLSLFGTTLTEFTCVLSSSGVLVFRTVGTASGFGENYFALICISITEKSTNSYMYYRKGGTETSDGGRYTVLADTDTISSSTSTYCTGTASTEDFGVLVKDGSYGDVAITLPNPFLGIYNYTFTSDGSTYQCSGTSSMDGCTDQTLVKLNTSLCNNELLDADNRQFHCVAYAESGSTYYIAMMHSDASTAHRSTCVTAVISDKIVTASTDPGSCKVGQTSSSRTTHSASVLITMVPYEICCEYANTEVGLGKIFRVKISAKITFLSKK